MTPYLVVKAETILEAVALVPKDATDVTIVYSLETETPEPREPEEPAETEDEDSEPTAEEEDTLMYQPPA